MSILLKLYIIDNVKLLLYWFNACTFEKRITELHSIVHYITLMQVSLIEITLRKELLKCMLDYLGNIMEDASDFSSESAKAAHAIFVNQSGGR